MIDSFAFVIWWGILLALGIIAMPVAGRIFSAFPDAGYGFARILGILIFSYTIFLIGTFRILPIYGATLSIIAVLLALLSLWSMKRFPLLHRPRIAHIATIEAIFFIIFLFWATLRGFSPQIEGLEKFMDLGLVNASARATFYPPMDMWHAGNSINYYYFGHLITAHLSMLGQIPTAISYNLMMATLPALTAIGAYSLVYALLRSIGTSAIRSSVGGFISAGILVFGGNLHILYSLFSSYAVDAPVSFWSLSFQPFQFPNAYWYPNATRFIVNTIHEFPVYSFIVSDLHGHVLDIPNVLLLLAISFVVVLRRDDIAHARIPIRIWTFGGIGWLLAVMYMTNAWDGLIYALWILLMSMVIFFRKGIRTLSTIAGPLIIGWGIASLPFSLFFTPFASGIGILCAPEALTAIGRIGPILFEADHCQRSPLWQLMILHGWFLAWYVIFLIWSYRSRRLFPSDLWILGIGAFGIMLMFVPEFVYARDIYPAHYRANTMFKFVYQSFILWSLMTGYIIIRMLNDLSGIRRALYCSVVIIVCIPLLIYPALAIPAFYGNLTRYQGLDGSAWLARSHPGDYSAIHWFNRSVTGQPVILESYGDSYTEYGRISVYTGLPTVLGWTVHQWLWRGSYDALTPRIRDIEQMYQATDPRTVLSIARTYDIDYIVIGPLEKKKFPRINEEVFRRAGHEVFSDQGTTVYAISQTVSK